MYTEVCAPVSAPIAALPPMIASAWRFFAYNLNNSKLSLLSLFFVLSRMLLLKLLRDTNSGHTLYQNPDLHHSYQNGLRVFSYVDEPMGVLCVCTFLKHHNKRVCIILKVAKGIMLQTCGPDFTVLYSKLVGLTLWCSRQKVAFVRLGFYILYFIICCFSCCNRQVGDMSWDMYFRFGTVLTTSRQPGTDFRFDTVLTTSRQPGTDFRFDTVLTTSRQPGTVLIELLLPERNPHRV